MGARDMHAIGDDGLAICGSESDLLTDEFCKVTCAACLGIIVEPDVPSGGP